jgi:hypothetical protein
MSEQNENLISLAVILDNQVQHVMRVGEELAALLLSGATFLDVTAQTSIEPILVGTIYDPETGTLFMAPTLIINNLTEEELMALKVDN